MTGFSASTRSGLGSVFAAIGAAIDVARAVETRRMPTSGALKALGIDEKTFRQINLG